MDREVEACPRRAPKRRWPVAPVRRAAIDDDREPPRLNMCEDEPPTLPADEPPTLPAEWRLVELLPAVGGAAAALLGRWAFLARYVAGDGPGRMMSEPSLSLLSGATRGSMVNSESESFSFSAGSASELPPSCVFGTDHAWVGAGGGGGAAACISSSQILDANVSQKDNPGWEQD